MSDLSNPSWPAPAKINLFLRITGRREDGYHNIQTLFQLLDWGDQIRIRPTRSPHIIRLPASYDVPAAEDLAVRAAQLLQKNTGCRRGAEIGVDKKVPLGSGMGGGSSDAATVLLVLNRLWDCGLGVDDLAHLGRGLGADVPVFVRGHSALAEGVGERLQPVSLGERYYVVLFPGFSISTAEIFSDPDLPRDSKPVSLAEAISGQGGNDCEIVVRKRFPALAGIMDSLQDWGRPVMTGTGSAIFMAMSDKKSAMSTANALKTLYNVRAVRGVDRSALLERLDSY